MFKELRNQDGDYVDEQGIRNRVFEFFTQKYNLTNNKVDNVSTLETKGFVFGTKVSKNI